MNEKPVAIVTAGSRGIGAGCARELADRGYVVSLMARSEDVMNLAQELGGRGYIGDVMREDDLANLVSGTVDAYGRVDAVVNNSGDAAKGDLLSLSDEAWHAGLDLLLLNVVRMGRLVTPIMQRQGGGAFVNISTFGAVEPSLAFPISSAIRAGLSAFTKVFGDRYASEHIRMNNVLPGFVETFNVTPELAAGIPIGRAATVSEIGKVAAFLLSEDASYITGQNIRVDAAMTRSFA